jgi:hypothetical protein
VIQAPSKTLSGRKKAQATQKAGAAKRSAASALDDVAAEVAAAEGAIEKEAEPRPAPPAKAAPRPRPSPAPPSEPTDRQKTLEQARENEGYKMLQDEVKKLSDELKKVHREKEQLKKEQKAKDAQRASQEQKPTKTNAQRRTEKVCVETNHKDHNILSFDAVWKPGCISPAGYPPITTQLV